MSGFFRGSHCFGSPMLARDHPRWHKALTLMLPYGDMMML